MLYIMWVTYFVTSSTVPDQQSSDMRHIRKCCQHSISLL